MIIAIAGLTGSGKNTLGEKLAEKLGYRLVCPTFKDLAAKEGIPLMEFQKKATKDPDIDKKFDAVLKEQASKGNCVVTTWLGPWMVEPDIRIWIYLPDDIRAGRIAKRDGITAASAKSHMQERDDNNRKRYLKLYKIDIDDHSSFDACLNSGIYYPEQLVEIALALIKTKSKK
jgi:cytidylate kinase